MVFYIRINKFLNSNFRKNSMLNLENRLDLLELVPLYGLKRSFDNMNNDRKTLAGVDSLRKPTIQTYLFFSYHALAAHSILIYDLYRNLKPE